MLHVWAMSIAAGGAWLVALTRTAEGFACRVTSDAGEGDGEGQRALDALDDAVSQLEMRVRLALGEPARWCALAG